MNELIQALRNYATWTREAQERGPHHPDSISIDDMDAEMLEEAAAALERLSDLPHVIAQLRHAYYHLVNHGVVKQIDFADGLLAPQIRKLEKIMDKQ